MSVWNSASSFSVLSLFLSLALSFSFSVSIEEGSLLLLCRTARRSQRVSRNSHVAGSDHQYAIWPHTIKFQFPNLGAFTRFEIENQRAISRRGAIAGDGIRCVPRRIKSNYVPFSYREIILI